MIDFEKIFTEFIVPHWTTGKNTSPGWVNVQCPMCQDNSNHGGFNTQNGSYVCWKCGTHNATNVLSKKLSISFNEAQAIISKNNIAKQAQRKQKETIHPTEVKLPLGWLGPSLLTPTHKKYLDKRNFNPMYLTDHFKIYSTLHYGPYKFRIIAPIYFKKKIVSFQGRDTTGEQVKYKACSADKEVIHHKHILYNLDNCQLPRIAIVEGITDVWRLGNNSAATFGVKFKKEQVNLISQYREVFIVFDSEEDAFKNAVSLADQLKALGCYVELIDLDNGDPGEMSQSDADHLMRELNLK